jgi:Holliday junction resolvasome RuvABC ATP-dependent DNA helicase subunit
MNEKAEQRIIHSDINTEFDELVSMNNLISNRHAVQIAQSYIDQYYNDLTIKESKLSPILLIGQSGMSTFARAISNSFGNIHFKYSHGSWFNSGIQDINSFYYNSDYGMTFYVSSIDKFDILAQHKLWRILSTKRVHIYEVENRMPIDAPLWNALHIFSAKNINVLTEPLLDQFPVIIYIGNLSRDEIFLALKQRLNLLCLSCDDSVLMSIAKVSSSIDEAIELLSMSYRVMRSQNETVLTTKIMNKAFCLMDTNLKTAAKNQLK